MGVKDSLEETSESLPPPVQRIVVSEFSSYTDHWLKRNHIPRKEYGENFGPPELPSFKRRASCFQPMEIPPRAPSIARATSCLWREEGVWGRRDCTLPPHEQGKGNYFSIPPEMDTIAIFIGKTLTEEF